MVHGKYTETSKDVEWHGVSIRQEYLWYTARHTGTGEDTERYGVFILRERRSSFLGCCQLLLVAACVLLLVILLYVA